MSLKAYRAARRILDSVSITRHTSRLFRTPYSPTILSSESLDGEVFSNSRCHIKSEQSTHRRAASKAVSVSVVSYSILLDWELTTSRNFVGLTVRPRRHRRTLIKLVNLRFIVSWILCGKRFTVYGNTFYRRWLANVWFQPEHLLQV